MSNSEFVPTDEQLAIIRLVCMGLTNKEIGEKIFKSVHTVKGRLAIIYAHSETKNRYRLIAKAREKNWVTDAPTTSINTALCQHPLTCPLLKDYNKKCGK